MPIFESSTSSKPLELSPNFEALMDAYDRCAEGLFHIRNEAQLDSYLANWGLSDEAFSVLPDYAASPMGAYRIERLLQDYRKSALSLRQLFEQPVASPAAFNLVVSETNDCLQRYNTLIKQLVSDVPGLQIWGAPLLTHQICISASVLRYLQDYDSYYRRASNTDDLDRFVQDRKFKVRRALSVVKDQTEKTLRITYNADAQNAINREYARPILGQMLGIFNEAQLIERNRELQFLRRKAEYVKKLSIELCSRFKELTPSGLAQEPSN